jgi:hypothetical protein
MFCTGSSQRPAGPQPSAIGARPAGGTAAARSIVSLRCCPGAGLASCTAPTLRLNGDLI